MDVPPGHPRPSGLTILMCAIFVIAGLCVLVSCLLDLVPRTGFWNEVAAFVFGLLVAGVGAAGIWLELTDR